MSAADVSLYSFTVAAILVLFVILESTEWGLSIVIPHLTKHAGDRRVLARILRPGFKGTELCLLAAVYLLTTVFPDYSVLHDEALWGGCALVFLSLLSRTALAWGCHGDCALARALAQANALLGALAIAGASWLMLTFLVEISVGMLPPSMWLWGPLAVLSALWAVAALSAQGAYIVAARTKNPLAERARAMALVLTVPTVVLYILIFTAACIAWNIPGEIAVSVALSLLPLVLYAGAFVAARRRRVVLAGWMHFTAVVVQLLEFLFTLWNVIAEFAVGSAMVQYALPQPVIRAVAIGTVLTIAAKVWRWRQPRETVATGYEWDTLRTRQRGGK